MLRVIQRGERQHDRGGRKAQAPRHPARVRPVGAADEDKAHRKERPNRELKDVRQRALVGLRLRIEDVSGGDRCQRDQRSEERRGGKEWSCRWWAYHLKKE